MNDEVCIGLKTFTMICGMCGSKKVTQQLSIINGTLVGERFFCHNCKNVEILYPTNDMDTINDIQWPEIPSGIYESDIEEREKSNDDQNSAL